jgi:hypothetical protein
LNGIGIKALLAFPDRSWVAAITGRDSGVDTIPTRAFRPFTPEYPKPAPVYFHTGDAELIVVPTTTDADLALFPAKLADEPLLEDALRAAGFELADNPGAWPGRFGVAVDLMVPEALSGGSSRRSARLPIQGDRAARRTAGLEPALVDTASTTSTRSRPLTREASAYALRVLRPCSLPRSPRSRRDAATPRGTSPRTASTSSAFFKSPRPT